MENFNDNKTNNSIRFRKQPEILSPAGSMESLISAVRSGADAVYLGSSSFNARKNASNFDINSSAEGSLIHAIKYCHIRGCKVYLTLNTLIREDELEEAFYLAKKAYLAGIDGIIIQDLGLAALLKKHIPSLALHASTQLSCHNADGVRSLIALGFKRVVLAREMSKSKIASCIGLGAEIEVFVHGALCMSVSGQCLMSANLGGRSGNRGLCAQTCRLPFEVGGLNSHNNAVKDNEESYALSLKDLSIIDKVDELCEMGVASLKIEGRMKRPEYVAAATAAFVDTRNRFYGDKSFPLTPPTKSELEDVFSRSGFTDGYFTNQVDSNMFGHRRYDDVVSAKSILPKLMGLFKDELPRIAVSFHLSIAENRPAELIAIDEDGNTVTVKGAIPETAINRALDKERALTQLSKSGNTPFIISPSCEISEGLTLPISAINALRRSAFEKLEEIRGDSQRVDDIAQPDFNAFNNINTKSKNDDKLIFAQFSNMLLRTTSHSDILQMIQNAKADVFIFPLSVLNSNLDLLSSAVGAAKSSQKSKQIGIEVPRGDFGLRNRDLGLKLEKLKAMGLEYLLLGNISAFEFLPKIKKLGLKMIANFSLNAANSFSVANLIGMGFDHVILSSELSLNQVGRISNPNTMTFAYGKQPLMMLRNCPIKAEIGCENCFYTKGDIIPYLTDRKNIDFQINCYKSFGFVELINSRPLYLADFSDYRKVFTGDAELLYFTDESPNEIQNIIESYRYFSKAKTPTTTFTRGLFKKGVL